MKLRKRIKDLTSKRFGSLLVIKFSHLGKHCEAIWHCKCDCGKKTKHRGNALTQKRVSSCGCLKNKDLTGKVFANTTVLKFLRTGKNKKSIYMCSCKCGKIFQRASDNLQRLCNVGCGCENLRSRLPDGVAASNTLFGNYKNAAKYRGFEWSLDKCLFLKLTKKSCHYCGTLPNNKTKYKRLASQYVYNGLDRVDNAVGYTEKNCVPCCKTCNMMKMKLSKNEFIRKVILIAKHFKA